MRLTSPLELVKEVMKADFINSDQSIWDPFSLQFEAFVVSFLHLSFSNNLKYILGWVRGSIAPSKVSISLRTS